MENDGTQKKEDKQDENVSDADILEAAKTLKAEQEKLAQERAKFDADKKAFVEIARTAEQSGRAAAGQKEPSANEKIDAEITEMFKGTGLNPLR